MLTMTEASREIRRLRSTNTLASVGARARDALRLPRQRRRPMRGLTVLVTGASSGIGAATAVEAGRLGATVIAVARRADLLDGVVDRINASAGKAASYP